MLRLGFLRSGRTIDCLKLDGKVPDEKDMLIMFAIVGARTETHCLRMEVGIGSSTHCLLGDLRINLVISHASVRRKESRGGGLRGG